MGLKPGDQVDHRYTIVMLLGTGGMGEVYQAFDERLQRNVALKLLHADSRVKEPGSDGSRGTARLLREARAAAQLEHPNVVGIFDVGTVHDPESLRGTAYLAMELVRGRSLRALLNEKFPLEERLRWLADIARALSSAHALGLVHRDVKPENVMLRSDGAIKVLDFGLAKRSHPKTLDAGVKSNEPQIVPTLTQEGVTVGTPYYMAPEQMRGEPLDGRADQFSWGVMAYEVLVGQGPWRIDLDALALITQVLSGRVVAPTDRNPAVPAHVARTIMRALAKEADDRFPTMDELLGSLRGDDPVATASTVRGSAEAALAVANELAHANTEAVTSPSRNLPTTISRPPPKDAADTGAAAPTERSRRLWLVVGTMVSAGAIAAGVATRTDAPTKGLPADASPTPECVSTADCMRARHGDAYRCRRDKGTCAPLASGECVVHADRAALESDETLWLGTLLPKDSLEAHAVELARRDFETAPATLPVSGRARRRIGVVACDDSGDAARSADHLVDVVGVNAIVGFSTSREAITLANDKLVPRLVMTVVARNTASAITRVRSPEGKGQLVWRTTDNTLQQGKAVGALVADFIEPRLSKERRRPLRVTLLRDSSAAGIDFSDAIVSSLHFNGKSVAENGLAFSEGIVGLQSKPTDPDAELATADILRGSPDVVVYYNIQLIDQVIRPLEAKWARGVPRPIYVSGLPLEKLGSLRDAPDLLRRLYGVTTPANTAVNTKFTLHYNASFPDKVTPTFSPNTAYDAFYLIAYATYALGDTPPSGEALARAVKQLVGPGTKIEVGPAKIVEALGALAAGETVDLEGAGSSLDFDLATGESPTDHVVLCAGQSPDGAPVPIESGLVWDARTDKLRGAMKCQ